MGGRGATPVRRIAFAVLRRTFEERAFTDRAFRAAADSEGLGGRDRAQAQHLAFGAVQRRGTSDLIVERLSGRRAAALDPPVAAALRLGVFELLFARATPDHAAVDQAVELAREAGVGRAAGFVNAVLRRCARERDKLLAGLGDAEPADAAVAHSVPEWLARLWWEEQGADVARLLLEAANRPAETCMRVNILRGDLLGARAQLEAGGVEVTGPGGPPPLDAAPLLVIRGQAGEAAVEMIAGGALTPQSRGSAAVIELLDPQPGERVLDLCGGPGIKATQMAERMEDRGTVVAVEPDAARCAEIVAGAARVGAGCVEAVEGDGRSVDLEAGFDRVLVDAPCSDLGTLASRPDVRWRKTQRQIEEVAELQAQLLDRAVELLAPGGVLVYSTCTISRRENEQQAARLAGPTADDLGALHPELASAADARFLQVRPDRDDTTGFFIARFRSARAG